MEREAKVQKLWTVAETAKALYDAEYGFVLGNYDSSEATFQKDDPEGYARWKALGDALKALHDAD